MNVEEIDREIEALRARERALKSDPALLAEQSARAAKKAAAPGTALEDDSHRSTAVAARVSSERAALNARMGELAARRRFAAAKTGRSLEEIRAEMAAVRSQRAALRDRAFELKAEHDLAVELARVAEMSSAKRAAIEIHLQGIASAETFGDLGGGK